MELVFDDLTPITVPVTIAGKKYTLREASEGAACAYRNASIRAAKMHDGKVVGLEGAADVEPLLVSLCLFDENNVPVSVLTVKSWPAKVVKPIFDKAKEISGLDETESNERKQLLSALQRQDAPVSLDRFREWVNTLGTDYDALQKLVEPRDIGKN